MLPGYEPETAGATVYCEQVGVAAGQKYLALTAITALSDLTEVTEPKPLRVGSEKWLSKKSYDVLSHARSELLTAFRPLFRSLHNSTDTKGNLSSSCQARGCIYDRDPWQEYARWMTSELLPP